MRNCYRCSTHVEDGRPVVIGRTSETKEVPARGQRTRDPAFVTDWDTVTVHSPEVETVCKDCHDPEEDQHPTTDMFQVVRR